MERPAASAQAIKSIGTQQGASRLWALALIAVAIASSAAQAGIPQLRSMAPQGAERGTEVEITLAGSDLADAQEILLYYPGVTVTEMEAVDDKKIKAKFQFDAECRLGIHALRVRSATGLSNLRTFCVGALPEVAEAEPNSEFSEPQKVELDTTITGVVQNEDVDYYLVEAKKGERITAEIEGIRMGNTFFDPYLAILDAQRFELAVCDDAALTWQDAVISLQAPEDGSYVVQVRESAFGGNGACNYRLHIGRFPRPTAVLPAGGKPNETVALKWLGDILGARSEQITPPEATPPESRWAEPFGLFARDERGLAPSPNAFVINELDNTMEAEPNDDVKSATAFEAPQALNGAISKAGDVDCFAFAAKKGQAFEIRVLARQIRSPLDPVLSVRRASGARVGANDDSGGPDAYLRFTAPADDQYVLSVRDHLGRGELDYVYRVELQPVRPELVISLPERRRYVDMTACVPQGNRTALMVSAKRSNFSGELEIALHDLPSGVSMETVPMAANQTTVPVLLRAEPGTTLSGALVDVIGRSTDPKLNVEGHLEQITGLARGRNNILVWGHTAHRMATAVTAAAPFTIELVEPKAPLVRNGSAELKVVAQRNEGFTAPIRLRMLYDPPGVSSSRDIQIPEGKNEAAIPVTANGKAEVNAWRIAVLGEPVAPDDGQQNRRRRRRGTGVVVSTQLAQLEVAEPFVGFAFNKTAVERGQETDFVVKVEASKPFEGEATVELLGLPFEATAEPLKMTKDTSELAFKVKTTAKSPVGRHKSLLCRATIMVGEEQVIHNLGSGELRIDAPLPKKTASPKTAKNAAPAAKAEKRLTRLEQLRQAREQALEAAKEKPAQPQGAEQEATEQQAAGQ